MFQNILVPLDGSARAERALPLAARLARASGGKLILVRVVDIQHRIAWQSADVPIDFDQLLIAEQEIAASYLAQTAHSEELAGLNVLSETAEGKPGEAILALAQEQGVDLILMSSHGYIGLKKWALGSVAQHIERHSHIPVLILRDETDSSEHILQSHPQPLRVIVPLDGHAQAEQILPAAAALSIALSAPARGAIHLALIVPDCNQQEMAARGEYHRALRDANAYLASVTQRLQQDEQIARHLVIASSVSQRSSISEALAAFATKGADPEGSGSYDVIAMATHGREGLDRLLHTSITEQVLDATRVPALVIKSVPVVSQNIA
jgi:nucleotide-binding universal stress UspA family protein